MRKLRHNLTEEWFFQFLLNKIQKSISESHLGCIPRLTLRRQETQAEPGNQGPGPEWDTQPRDVALLSGCCSSLQSVPILRKPPGTWGPSKKRWRENILAFGSWFLCSPCDGAAGIHMFLLLTRVPSTPSRLLGAALYP